MAMHLRKHHISSHFEKGILSASGSISGYRSNLPEG
jgi:hypothetical protein